MAEQIPGNREIVVGTNDVGLDATGDYVLTLARMPGSFAVSPGDQGGAMSENVNHAGRIEIGDVDMWSFGACQGQALTLTIAEVPVCSDLIRAS